MAYLAAPIGTYITEGLQYFYVIPQIEATSITVTQATGFTTSIAMGSPARLTFTYTGAHQDMWHGEDISLLLRYPDGTTATQTIHISVGPGDVSIPDQHIIRNITNPNSLSVAPSAPISFSITHSHGSGALAGVGAEDLPSGLSCVLDRVNGVYTGEGKIVGTAPSSDGFYVMKLVTESSSSGFVYKRYFVLIVGTGGTPSGGGGVITGIGSGGPKVYFDGDFTQAQISGAPEFEIPFKCDPKPYVYNVTYWQLFDSYNDLVIGDSGPFGGSYIGLVPGSFKTIGGGVVEFKREFALVPDTRNEYESYVADFYFSFFTAGFQNACTDPIPLTTTTRLQFDYFQTDNPESIDLLRKPAFVNTCLGTAALNGAMHLVGQESGAEFLCEDALLKLWKPGIYERRQRFARWLTGYDIVTAA